MKQCPSFFSSNERPRPSNAQPSESKRDPVRFEVGATCSTVRARSSSRLCVANAACCCASRSRFASFNASRLCAFWRCFFVCDCDCDAVVVVAVPVAPPAPSDSALLGSVKKKVFQSDIFRKHGEKEELTAPASDDAPTTIFLARCVFTNLHTFIILPRKSLCRLLARRRAYRYNGRWCTLK